MFTKKYNLISKSLGNTQTNACRKFCAHGWSCCMCSVRGAVLIGHKSFCSQKLSLASYCVYLEPWLMCIARKILYNVIVWACGF